MAQSPGAVGGVDSWGLWAGEGMAGLDEREVSGLASSGVLALDPDRGLELFDAAVARDEGLVVAVGLDRGVLRSRAQAGVLPGLLSGLVSAPRRSRAGAGVLAKRLGRYAEADREKVVLALVRELIADVLGFASASAVEPHRTFKEFGLDSLGAVELQKRLRDATGVQIPATMVFDHPTPAAVASFLLERVGAAQEPVRAQRRTVVRHDEPIAIVGMGCRFPGAVSTPAELWELVADGRDAISSFPADRNWDLEALYDPDPDKPGTCYVREGGFIDHAADFDADFFGIGETEALAMDPQQRVLLEVAWEALEDAMIAPASLRGTETGVFIGAVASEYPTRVDGQYRSVSPDGIDAQRRVGPRRLRLRVGGPGGHRGHRLLVVVGGAASRLAGAAGRRVRPRARRGRHRDGVTRLAGRLRPTARAVAGCAVPVVRGRRERSRFLRGMRCAGPRTAVGCSCQGA